jgi:hypothetical protein
MGLPFLLLFGGSRPPGVVTQTVSEVFGSPDSSALVTQAASEVFGDVPTFIATTTQEVAEVFGQVLVSQRASTTQVVIEVFGRTSYEPGSVSLEVCPCPDDDWTFGLTPVPTAPPTAPDADPWTFGP